MKLALDCQISFKGAKILNNSGHTVVYHARHEHDQLWVRRAVEKGAEVFISPDWDIDIMCNQLNLYCIKLKQKQKSEDAVQFILKELKRYETRKI